MEAKKGALLPHPLRLISLLSFTAVMCFFDFSMALEGSPFCRENERVALLDFKASHSTNATLMDSWKGLNCCEWEGVKCHSSSSHVVSLRVYRIPWNITGYTNSVMLNASSLTRLGQLQHLGLSSFAGVLPIKELSKLKNLRELILDFNEFSGGIPEEVGLLSSLQVLYLNGNRLQGRIPSTLGNLSLLNSLQLYENQLSGSIPESLGSLLSLEWLGLGNNKLEGSIPSTLGNLSLLNELLLYGNQLSGSIPESLGSLLSLKRLDLGENKLEGSIPCELGKLYSLVGLFLNDNDLSGDFSFTVFANVSSLKIVHLSANPKLTISHNNFTPAFQLYALNLSLCDMRRFDLSSPGFLSTQNQLVNVDLSKSDIPGNIPSWLLLNTGQLLLDGNLLTGVQFLPNISYDLNNLDISNNQISRNFPRNFSSHFPNLQSLKMSQNSLDGDLMFYINGFKGLRVLDLSRNNISGNLPSIFPYNLTILDLSNNKITGELPPNLTRGHDLMFLSLSKNSLNGPLQSKHFKLPNLVSLHLDNNAFNGTIPRNLLLFSPNLTILNLANNEISGPMPIELFGHFKLKVLILRGNFFDHIPLKLCQVKSLAVLDFSQNNLEGPIPPCFNNFSAWTNASFIGSISSRYDPFFTFSTELGSGGRIVYKLYTISQENVEFTKGNTYSYLGDALKYMTGLDLSENKLSGPIPLDMGLLKELAMLNLSNNLLTGPIPKSFGGLLGLSTLDLSCNALSGEFPSQLTRLTHLSIFSVANNNLSGEIPDTTQFCTFNESSFSGNPNLNTQGKRCSTTLSSNVPTGPSDDDGEDEDEGEEGWVEMTPAVYAFIALGYAIGIWGALAFLFFGNKRGHACVRAMDAIVSRLFRAFCRKH
ncbi:probably inactive leucine-rich repeat receptor-like protein kinase At2g25790 isoform X1 [Amborella trichopoda]|uniref:Leucine-rich repeat-containing N-terminal plant-type domain-containing protein n=1 Tax=Amborella trichopoda TaxID=13333 RepID=W1NF42_AMBTC|nr:probably inactive leucine-rich repeat receptor-like protein kinase At2g25790 isoform X1 [Amborella trichopoda]ERM94422.1 hypothetical protein AMTR_s00010p00257150 [Amborella trichopoda]|eukprot:XP_006827185.1 probably inactive leucine-rich repeat receptor-like protein kinase At2g25790 isoform X1 [Amborella trichopoda]